MVFSTSALRCVGAILPAFVSSFFLFRFFRGRGIHINSLGVLFRGTGAWCILGGCVLVLTHYLRGGFTTRVSFLFSGG